jgi:hypothetical protein
VNNRLVLDNLTLGEEKYIKKKKKKDNLTLEYLRMTCACGALVLHVWEKGQAIALSTLSLQLSFLLYFMVFWWFLGIGGVRIIGGNLLGMSTKENDLKNKKKKTSIWLLFE